MARDWMKPVLGVEPPVEVQADLGPLRVMIAGVEAAPSTTDAATLARAWLADATAVSAAATAMCEDPKAVNLLLARLGARRGMASIAEQVRRLLRTLARDQERDSRRGTTPTSSRASLAEILDWQGLPPQISCPPGWQVSRDGVQKVLIDPATGAERLIPVATRPIVLVGTTISIEDNDIRFAVAWPVRGRWWTEMVPREQVSSARAVVGLARCGAPVSTNNAADVIAYLLDFEAFNELLLPQLRVVERMGWHGDGAELRFIWGLSTISARGAAADAELRPAEPGSWSASGLRILADEPGQRSFASGFAARGTWEGWRALMELLRPFPSMYFALYAALAPPLMRFLPVVPNFVVEWCGATSLGKTTALRVAASAWGNPDDRNGGIVHHWDNTRVFLERAPWMANYLPTFFDDTKRAKHPEDVAKAVYDFAGGVGRGRGTLRGMQRTSTFHGVLFSSGEVPITSFTNDGGTRSRALCLWGSPLGKSGRSELALVRKLETGLLSDYGHAGPRMIRWILEDPRTASWVETEHERELGCWTARAGSDSVLGRHAAYLAVLAVARRMTHEMLGLSEPDEDALEFAWSQARGTARDADRAADALRDVLSWATAQQHRFYGRIEHETGAEGPPNAGWLGAWALGDGWTYVAVLPTELRGFLERQKFDVEAVLRTWSERRWLQEDAGHRTRKVHVGQRKERCYVLTREACSLVQGSDEAT